MLRSEASPILHSLCKLWLSHQNGAHANEMSKRETDMGVEQMQQLLVWACRYFQLLKCMDTSALRQSRTTVRQHLLAEVLSEISRQAANSGVPGNGADVIDMRR